MRLRAHRSKDAKRSAPARTWEGGWGGGGGGERERERERARASALALAPLFICFSLPGPVLCKLGQPGVLFVLPEVLTLVLRPSFILFSLAFPFLVF